MLKQYGKNGSWKLRTKINEVACTVKPKRSTGWNGVTHDAGTWLLQGKFAPRAAALSLKLMVVTISLPNKHSFWTH
jgi:hypothetical protein